MDTVLFFHTSQRQAWRKELVGAYRFARMRGWRVQIVEPPEGGGAPPVAELLGFWKPAGCIAECSGMGGDKFTPGLFGNVPVVFLGGDPAAMPAGTPCVSPAPDGIGECVAREFLKAGLEHFAFVATGGGRFWSHDRENGFVRALSLHGFKCDVFGRDPGLGSGPRRSAALAIFLKALPKPCGVLAENDYAAVEVVDLARRAHLNVPEALSVVGVDNDGPLCENSRPTLTSVALDFESAGFRSCELLDAKIRGEPVQEHETYPALGLARRGSTPTGLGVPPRIHQALAFIREHACEGIGVREVAALLPGSRRLAELEFRHFAGRGIYEEIERVRFERVELLLRDRSRAIGAIAAICGWRTEGALRAAFLKRYGMPMRAWRAGRFQKGPPTLP